jgi:pyridoxine 4-dehydrogenase
LRETSRVSESGTEERDIVSDPKLPGGTFALAPGMEVTRMGYGAMQLAGPGVFGPPADRDEAIAVLREVVDSGITHIDTSDYYGPFVTNALIKEALYPYPASLRIVTKVGARRDAEGAWLEARSPDALRRAIHENLDHLGLEAIDVVNLRLGGFARPEGGSLAEPFEALVELQEQGLIRHIGLSTVSAEQIKEAQSIAPIACVQNFYNVAHRDDDALVDSLAKEGIAYVPYFPLGGFTTLQSTELATVATRLDTSPLAVALAWLMQRSPNILLIPGTSSRAHLRDNIAGATLALSEDDRIELDRIAA